MRDYRLFGGILRSEMTLPGLPDGEPDATGPADWTVTVAPGAAPEPPAPPLGEDRVTPDARVRLHRDGDDGAFLLAFDDTGVFRLSPDGSRIRWTPYDDVSVEDARLDLLGRVVPFALHLRGLFVLHASAVATDDGAVALVGPKGRGKSTLAHALVRRGATLLTDDALPVRADPEPVVWPGVRRLRLRPDVAASMPPPEERATRRRGRTEVGFQDEDPVAGELPVPLRRIYLLDPRPADGDGPLVRCEPITGPRATAALLGQAKLGPLLEPWAAGELLRQTTAIVRGLAVRRLEIVRDLDLLDEVAGFVLAGGDDVSVETAVGR